MSNRRVLVTTLHKGVFYGTPEGDTTGTTIVLTGFRVPMYWGTTKGIWELADTGPTASSKIGAKAPRIELRDITAVCEVSEEAAAKWDALP